MVLGAADAGKSTLCRVILAHAARAGRPMAVLDADPAQKLLGPPACVTLGHGIGGQAAAIAFLGTLNPLQGWQGLIAGVRRLSADAGSDGLLLVNTSGLLAGAGRRLKAAKIAAARPDLLLALGEDPGLEAVLRDHVAIPTLRLPRSPLARRKGEGQRRALRRLAFRAYFAGAPAWLLALDGLRPEGVPPDGADDAAGCLLALEGADGRDLVLGVVLADERPARLHLRAPRPTAPPAALRWGALRLGEDWSDRPRIPLRRPAALSG
jgi:polynucleotide 5'-hydroxyl-kinase GRC3/NOL9